MLRRDFLFWTAGGLSVLSGRALADHHLLSVNPMIVDFDLTSLVGRYTPTNDFYVRNHFQTPPPPGTAFLQIEGAAENPRRLGVAELRGLTQSKIGAVLECAGEPVTRAALASDGLWTGWRLADVLSIARPRTAVLSVHLAGRDGFSRTVTFDRAMNDGFIATGLNGRPLLPIHGAPWRALFPGWYGMDSVKWLERIILSREPPSVSSDTYLQLWRSSPGKVQKKPLPRIRVKSVITSPENGAIIHSGILHVQGLAWTGSGRIASVEVSDDGGLDWAAATLENAGELYDWTTWRCSLDMRRAGPAELICRATDTRGNSQPAHWDPRRIDFFGYNVWDRVRCVVE